MATIGAAARWPEEARWIVACSGGADSLALLALAARTGHDIVAVHVDHGLRPASAYEARVVETAAAACRVEARSMRVSLAHGTNLEARARAARYAALEEARLDAGADVVLTGHTLDDQAETVLLALLRGSGRAGLGGMPARRDRIVRPLLEVRRAQTHELCRLLGWAPVADPMNDDRTFTRVWLRREVIPRLEAGADRDLIGVLGRQARVLRDESDLLDSLADEALAPAMAADHSLACAALCTVPIALARRMVRRWLPSAVAADHVDAVLAVARGERRATNLLGGLSVRRTSGRLVVERVEQIGSTPPDRAAPVSLTVPGEGRFGDMVVRARVERAAPAGWPDGRSVAVLDADIVGEELVVRAARPDERFRPLGLAGTKTVARARAESGFGAARHATVPVVARADGEIVWVLGYRGAHRARVTTRTRRYCWLSVADR